MAPERIRATRIDELTPLADVYSFGITLFELIYRHSPFDVDVSVSELFRRILREPVAIPKSSRIPSELRNLIVACTAKNPAQRPTVSNLLKEVRDVRHGVAARGLLSAPIVEIADPRRRRGIPTPLVLAASAASVVVLIAATLTHKAHLAALLGVSLIVLGTITGVATRLWLHRLRLAADSATQILFGLHDKRDLTKSLYIQIEQVIARCQDHHEQFLGTGIALLLQEYREANASGDRQAALINAMLVFEKLLGRLSPWYVRHEKLLSLAVAVVSVLPGIITFIIGIVRK